MAHIEVVHDTDPALRVELSGGDSDYDWDGTCTGCPWRLRSEGRSFDLAYAIRDSEVHLDHHH